MSDWHQRVGLRLLDRGGKPVQLTDLGMFDSTLESMGQLASRAHGLVLVTGPTGSGKTTTLYATLQQRETGAQKIITVEDPVEYHLPGVTQVPVHRQAGVSFASALRSILRQDPDVVMIGEMRDAETAEIAMDVQGNPGDRTVTHLPVGSLLLLVDGHRLDLPQLRTLPIRSRKSM